MLENEDSPFDFSNEGGPGDAPPAGSPATSGTEAKTEDATAVAEAPDPSGETAPEKAGEVTSDEMTDEEYEKLRRLANPKLRKRLDRAEEELKGLKGKSPETPAELAPVLEAAESLGGIPVLQETAALASTFLDTTLPRDEMAGKFVEGLLKLSPEQTANVRDFLLEDAARRYPDTVLDLALGSEDGPPVTKAEVLKWKKAFDDAAGDGDWAEPDKKTDTKEAAELPPEVKAKLDRLDELEKKLAAGEQKQTAEEIEKYGEEYERGIWEPVDSGLKALGIEPESDDADEIRTLTEREFFKNEKAGKLAKRAADFIARGERETADRLKAQLKVYADEAFRKVAQRHSERVKSQAEGQRRELESKRRPELTGAASAQFGKKHLPAWDEVTPEDTAAFGA